MEKFIRLDEKGEWRGKEHRSSVCGAGEMYEELFEEGISCYSLNDAGEAIEKLRNYWVEHASLRSVNDYENMQVTIFEGERLHNTIGADWEDQATCEKTICEIDAKPFMGKVLELFDLHYFEEELTETEYHNELEKLVKKWV